MYCYKWSWLTVAERSTALLKSNITGNLNKTWLSNIVLFAFPRSVTMSSFATTVNYPSYDYVYEETTTIAAGFIVLIIIGVILSVSLIIAIVCCAYRRQTYQGQVIGQPHTNGKSMTICYIKHHDKYKVVVLFMCLYCRCNCFGSLSTQWLLSDLAKDKRCKQNYLKIRMKHNILKHALRLVQTGFVSWKPLRNSNVYG